MYFLNQRDVQGCTGLGCGARESADQVSEFTL